MRTLKHIRRNYIDQVLAYFHGNKTITARAIGCTPNTIYNALKDDYPDDYPPIALEPKVYIEEPVEQEYTVNEFCNLLNRVDQLVQEIKDLEEQLDNLKS